MVCATCHKSALRIETRGYPKCSLPMYYSVVMDVLYMHTIPYRGTCQSPILVQCGRGVSPRASLLRCQTTALRHSVRYRNHKLRKHCSYIFSTYTHAYLCVAINTVQDRLAYSEYVRTFVPRKTWRLPGATIVHKAYPEGSVRMHC